MKIWDINKLNDLKMNVLYYYFFLFYSKVLKDDEPHMLTILALSACEGFMVNIIVDVFTAKCFCSGINSFFWMGTIALFIFLNYLYFYKSGKAKELIKKKPMFFSSNSISIFITILFFILMVSSIFWGPIYTKHILDTHCR